MGWGLCSPSRGASTPGSLGWLGRRGLELTGPQQAAATLPFGCQLPVPALCPRAVLPCGGGLSFGSSLKIACYHFKMSPSNSSILCRLCRYMLGTCPCVNSRAERWLARSRKGSFKAICCRLVWEKSLFGSEDSPAAVPCLEVAMAGRGSKGSHLLLLPASLWAGAGCPGRGHVVPFRCQLRRCRPFPALLP